MRSPGLRFFFTFITLLVLQVQTQAVPETSRLGDASDSSDTFHQSITTREYGDFLNATDRLEDGSWRLEEKSCTAAHFYDEKMSSGSASILRSGEPGSYQYELTPTGDSEASMLFLSENDAARCCEWLNRSRFFSSSL